MWPAYPQTIDEYHQTARKKLLQRNVITRQKEVEKVVIHSLIQDAVRSRITEDQYDRVFNAVVCFVSAVWPYEVFSFANGK